ncbi:unnamed protein product [Adineta ricciae]|uniref:Glycosyltransferase 61 catalytic domain-containing protein n=1 Tax=Adineta ricciae TaxID=249248 RepID=A0A815KL74_ADIRI|nr:unnamed protein product [Adineta ricciae]
MRRKSLILTFVIIIFSFAIVNRLFISRLPICGKLSSNTPSLSTLTWKDNHDELWKIPEWVERYNVTHLFDWTWHKNGDYKRCRPPIIRLPQTTTCSAGSTIVVNNALEFFRSHPEHGCVVDDIARLPNLIPHPLPRTRSLSDTCSELNIKRDWILCNKPQVELDRWLPTTTRLLTVAIFNAYVDTGHCHPDVPGTIFTEYATYHLQRWTNRWCNNDPIRQIPTIDAQNQHSELIDTIGNYLSAPGHFGPQQLPRLLRLLATAPTTAKVLVAKGGVADGLIDILVDRGVVTRDRIVPYEKQNSSYHYAHIVYRSEAWPYLNDASNSHYVHDRTDMQLVHRVLAADKQGSDTKRNLVILIKRKIGATRSIIEHSHIAVFIESALSKSKLANDLHLAIFEAHGHMREHIDLFRRARIIVGPHGAGMMNILWAPPGTHVVEVGYTDGMRFPDMYAEMSLHLDHHYWICKGYGNYAKPIHIDMEDFTFIFNEIIYEIENAK